MLLARWLGPRDYGNLAFLLGTFIALRQVLDMGTSSAFFTFLSQSPKSYRFVCTYFLFLATQFLVCAFVIWVVFPADWVNAIWHGQDRSLVVLAFGAAFMQHSVWPAVQQAGESQRRTLPVQGIGALVSVVHLGAVVLLGYFDLLGLYAIFAAVILEYLLAGIVAHRGFKYAPSETTDKQFDSLRSVGGKFWTYCSPLVVYSIFGFAYDFADRWLLQRFGGSVEQAYYAVGAQFAAIALIATTSILRIFWKEVAEAHSRGDQFRTAMLYRKISRLLYLFGAVIAGLLIPWSSEILVMALGESYLGGVSTLGIMFLYPVHQSLGQIGGTMFLATEKVSLQVKIGIVFMLSSMVVTYFVLAPPDAKVPGLGMASEGLAIKMCIMQAIQVNVIGYVIARVSGWSFDWFYQPVSLLGCLGLGWISHYGVENFISDSVSTPILMIVGGMFYLFLVIICVLLVPSLCGLSREDLVGDFSAIRKFGLAFAFKKWWLRND